MWTAGRSNCVDPFQLADYCCLAEALLVFHFPDWASYPLEGDLWLSPIDNRNLGVDSSRSWLWSDCGAVATLLWLR